MFSAEIYAFVVERKSCKQDFEAITENLGAAVSA